MIVTDASSLAKYILREKNWKLVRNYLLNEPHSLNLALAEVSNAIWKHSVLYGRISKEQADRMFKVLEKLKEVVVFEPLEKYLEKALKIAIDSNITVYDAQYVVQAERRIGKLLTSDNKQRDIAEKYGIEVIFIK